MRKGIDKMFCKNCGQIIPDNAAFCTNCGEPAPSGLNTQQPADVPEKKSFDSDFSVSFGETKPENSASEYRQEPVNQAPQMAPVSVNPTQPSYQQPQQQPSYPQTPGYGQQPVYQQQQAPVYPQPQPMYSQPPYQPVYRSVPPYSGYGSQPPVQASGFAKGGIFLILVMMITGTFLLFYGKILGIPSLAINEGYDYDDLMEEKSLDYEYYSLQNMGELGSDGDFSFIGAISISDIGNVIEQIDKMGEYASLLPESYQKVIKAIQWIMIITLIVILLNYVAIFVVIIASIFLLVRFFSGEYAKAWSAAAHGLRMVLCAQIMELIMILTFKMYMSRLADYANIDLDITIFRIAPHLLIAMGVIIACLIICGRCQNSLRRAAYQQRYY